MTLSSASRSPITISGDKYGHDDKPALAKLSKRPGRLAARLAENRQEKEVNEVKHYMRPFWGDKKRGRKRDRERKRQNEKERERE